MRFSYSSAKPASAACDLLVIGVFEGAVETPAVRQVDAALHGHLSVHLKDEEFTGAEGSLLSIHSHGKIPARKVVLLGLGKPAAFSAERLRRATGRAVKIASSGKAGLMALSLPLKKLGAQDAVQTCVEGAWLATYTFDRYKKDDGKKKKKVLETLTLLHEGLSAAAIRNGEALGTLTSEAAGRARDLVNTPSLDMTPKAVAAEAEKISKASSGRVKLKTFDRTALEKMGCGGILGVAQGSMHEPYMIHFKYSPKGRAKKRIVLVGKGVTFDSGGLSLKPADSMMDMKIDMAGAAAVVGVFSVLSRLNLPLEIHGIAALVENMPSATAIRPGDIVKTMSGKTIEILNTDAEGRVILADALFYGTKQKPDMMIDLATLTGACMVALGHDVAGLMSTDKKLTQRLLAASERTGEAAWELPLVPEYAEMVKSRHADVKNITGGRYGGAITAGLFLKEFVGETPWTHLDIAGPAYNERDYPDYRAWGASGFGVRLLLDFLRSL
jgi:leucyl aminopeptidase